MGKDFHPFISIITLNYNQTSVTCDFLESTKTLNYRNFEILVCDMDSKVDPTEEISKGNYPQTKLLLAGKNLGFAAGNNWGMDHAKGDFIFIVNNDTEVTPDLLDRLLEPFQNDPTIGVTCPKIKYFDQPDTIQYAGFEKMSPFTGRTSTIGNYEKDNGQHDTPFSTFGAHGCAMLVKKEVIEKIGRFPEVFFLYYEEWDWSTRIRKGGYKIWYTPTATIYHKESLSVGKDNPMKVYYHTRNRILYMRRNGNLFERLGFTMFFTFFTFPKNTLMYLVRGQKEHLNNFLKGTFWNLKNSSYSKV